MSGELKNLRFELTLPSFRKTTVDVIRKKGEAPLFHVEHSPFLQDAETQAIEKWDTWVLDMLRTILTQEELILLGEFEDAKSI